jgi:hypothetical protein
MRLSGPQPRQVISELGIAAARPPQFVPGPWVTLLVNRLIRRALHYLPGREAQCLCSRAPPLARRLLGLGSIDVVAAGAPLGTSPALVLPDVVQVVALGDGHDHGQQLPPSTSRGRGTDHDHSDECNGLRGSGSWSGRTAQDRWQRPAKDDAGRSGKGQLPDRTTTLGSAAEMPVLGADAVWRSYEVIIEARVAKSLVALSVSGGALGDQPSDRQA